MRTITAAQDKVLTARSRAVHVRVSIDRGSADWVDMTALDGRNWVMGCSLSESANNRVGTATVDLMREVYRLSLAPLDDDSKLNASGTIVDVQNPIKIETATIPQDSTPAESDFVEIFRGRVDGVSWSSDIMRLSCSDAMGALVSTFIEDVEEYGGASPTGDPMEDVLQEIIDDNINTPGISPYSTGSPLEVYSVNGSGGTPFNPADSPSANVNLYEQNKVTTMSALQAVVQTIGYDLRWAWHENTDQFQLVFQNIDRTTTTTVRTFAPDLYYNLTALKIETKDVRNVVRVFYYDTDSDGKDAVYPKEIEDTDSITKYGRRFMQVGETASRLIDSLSEATIFAQAALDDLSEPYEEMSVNLPFFFAAQLQDYYTFSAAGDPRYSTDQKLAVVGITHTFNSSEATTALKLRGKPSGGSKRWLSVESRPGVALSNPAGADNTPPTATGVSAVPTIGGFTVGFVDPKRMEPTPLNWTATEVHVSASSGFTPSSATLKETARTNLVPITDLQPGITKYIKVLHRDRFGKISTPGSATEVSATTQTVGPYHMNPDWRFGVVVQNGGFNISTLDQTTTAPDYWTPLAGSWGASDELYFKSTEALTASGGRSMWFRGNGTAARTIFSSRFPVSRLETYINRVRYRIASTVSGNSLSATVYWWKVDGSTASTTATTAGATADLGAAAVDTWNETTAPGLVPPSDARFGSVAVTVNPAGGAQDVYVDSMTLNACPVAFNVQNTSTQNVTKVYSPLEANDAGGVGQFNYGSIWDTSGYKFQTPHAGIYSFSFAGVVDGVDSGAYVGARLYTDTDPAFGSPTEMAQVYSSQSDGTAVPINASFGSFELVSDLYVKLYIAHHESGASTRTLQTNAKLSAWEVTNGLV